MKKKSVFRMIMLAAGLLSVVVILISPSFSMENTPGKAQTDTPQEETSLTIVTAPTEALPGTAIELEDSEASLLESLIPDQEEKGGLTGTGCQRAHQLLQDTLPGIYFAQRTVITIAFAASFVTNSCLARLPDLIG